MHPALQYVLGFATDLLFDMRVPGPHEWAELDRLVGMAASVPENREASIALARRAWEAAEIAAFLCGGPDVDEAGGRALELLNDPVLDLEEDLNLIEMLSASPEFDIQLIDWARFQSSKEKAPYAIIGDGDFPIGDREAMNLRTSQLAWCARESSAETCDSAEHASHAMEAAGAAMYAVESAAYAVAGDYIADAGAMHLGVARFLLAAFVPV